ncbi:conserved hypothetical protein [Burkholderia vietnamiensis]|nr:conserved hypothetical protein [Burkholderia vietnamiensis]
MGKSVFERNGATLLQRRSRHDGRGCTKCRALGPRLARIATGGAAPSRPMHYLPPESAREDVRLLWGY